MLDLMDKVGKDTQQCLDEPNFPLESTRQAAFTESVISSHKDTQGKGLAEQLQKVPRMMGYKCSKQGEVL